jgi:hypothetical protein
VLRGLPLCARGRREEEEDAEERERRASRSARRAPAGSRMAVAADARVASPAPRVCLRVKKRTLRRTFWNGLRCFSGLGDVGQLGWASSLFTWMVHWACPFYFAKIYFSPQFLIQRFKVLLLRVPLSERTNFLLLCAAPSIRVRPSPAWTTNNLIFVTKMK